MRTWVEGEEGRLWRITIALPGDSSASSSQDRDSRDTDDSKPSDNRSVTAKPKTWESPKT
jgi:hypothetical protein